MKRVADPLEAQARRKRPAQQEAEEGTIERRLQSMYPSDPAVKLNVESLKVRKLSELEGQPSIKYQGSLEPRFLVALADFFSDGASQIVEAELPRMRIRCTVKTVELLPDNHIVQLEGQYQPMYEDVEPLIPAEEQREDGLSDISETEVHLEDDDDLEDDEKVDTVTKADSRIKETSGDFEKELGCLTGGFPGGETGLQENPDVGSSSLPSEVRKGSLKLSLYEFEGKGFVSMVWENVCTAPKLLVRKHYLDVRKKVQRMWRDNVTQVLLTGNPGIGKTGYLIFQLVSLLSRYKPVVFRTKGGTNYFFQPPFERKQDGGGNFGVVPDGYRCYQLRNNILLTDPYVYFLADGKLVDPPDRLCKSVLASIPLKTNSKEYVKDGRQDTLVLPVWTAAEIALAWQEVYDPRLSQVLESGSESEEDDNEGKEDDEAAGSGSEDDDAAAMVRAKKLLTLDVVKDRYSKWGGTPRYVLERPQTDLGKVIAGLPDIQACVEAMAREAADADHPSYKLAFMKVRPGYQGYGYMYASPYVLELVTQKLKKDESDKLRLILRFNGPLDGLNGLKGPILQSEFMKKAVGKQSLRVRQLFQDIKKTSKERSKVFDFHTPFHGLFHVSDCCGKLPSNRIIWPGSKIEGAFDALKIVQRRGRQKILELYQVTVSSGRNQHGLKYEAVMRVMNLLGFEANRTRVYIATTTELFPTAGWQKWLRPGGKVVRDKVILESLAGITQYALDTTVGA